MDKQDFDLIAKVFHDEYHKDTWATDRGMAMKIAGDLSDKFVATYENFDDVKFLLAIKTD